MTDWREQIILENVMEFQGKDGIRRTELFKKCQKGPMAKKTFDRHLKRLTIEGIIIKNKDPNKAQNSTTYYKLAIDEEITEMCKDVISAVSDFKEIIKNKKISTSQIVAGCSYIIQMYAVLYQMSARFFLFNAHGTVIYDIMLDALKKRLDEFRILCFKRLQTKRRREQFAEESRLLLLLDWENTVTKFHHVTVASIKPRTIEEILLDHNPSYTEFDGWEKFGDGGMKYSRIDEIRNGVAKQKLHDLEKSRRDKAEQINTTYSIIRILSQVIDGNDKGSNEQMKKAKIELGKWSDKYFDILDPNMSAQKAFRFSISDEVLSEKKY